MPAIFNALPQDQNVIQNGSYSLVYAIPNGINLDTGVAYSGADSTTSTPKGWGVLCTLESMDNFNLEAIVSQVVKKVGKADIQWISGARIPDFSLMVETGDIRTLQVLTGKNPSSTTANAWIARPDFGLSCHLMVMSFSKSGALMRSVLVPNLSMKLTEVASTGAAEEFVRQKVTFYSPSNAQIFMSMGTKSFACGFWKTNAINAAAPNGVLVDFVMGTGNVAGGTGATSPVPLKLDDEYIAATIGSGATDLNKYFVGVWVNGVLMTATQFSYVSGTRTLTAASTAVVPNLASLMAVYLCDYTTALPENWVDGTTTVVEMGNFSWADYV